MSRYLNPMPAPASCGNIAINTATAITVRLAPYTSDVELTCTVDAVASIGLAGQTPSAANVSAGAPGQQFLGAYATRGFSVAGNAAISVIALSGNGAIYVSEMS
ncbi:MAG: hypothetical protein WBM00_02160 [Solirubrobacterales bacterium]